MKKMKRIFAVLLTLAMVLGMSITIFADQPKEGDSKEVIISNVETGATYNAYQIIDAEYESGFTGYVWAPGIAESETIKAGKKVEFTVGENQETLVTGLNDALITKLAKNANALTTKKENFNPATEKLDVGTWMILVTPPTENPAKVYNPMIVSVYYAVEDGNIASGSIDANQNWTIAATKAYAKSSEIDFKKDLDNAERDTMVAVGDTVPFTITSTIPSYSSTYYENPLFKISDMLQNGLKYKGEPDVYLGTISEDNKLKKDTDYTLTYEENTSFVITMSFTSEKFNNLANVSADDRKVTVRYNTEVVNSVVNKVGENTAELEYTSTPGVNAKKTDKEYVFSYALHNVFSKQDGSGKQLDKAFFTLYVENKESEDTIAWGTDNDIHVSQVGDPYETGIDGDIKFKGLDGNKVYYIKETKAPDGYSINETIYKVEFSEPADLDSYAGGDTTYTITVTNNKTSDEGTYTVAYGSTQSSDDGNSPSDGSSKPTVILNTKLSSLPSTGGIGTTIFTIAGCLIMIAAAGLFFVSRRKTEK